MEVIVEKGWAMPNKKLLITGIRGVPASHGGFETFAENLAKYLQSKGWTVLVYCQESVDEYSGISESDWGGVRLIHIPVRGEGAKATVVFDYLSIKHAAREGGLVLTLGYNTALFNFLLRRKGVVNLINMDGIEWKRDKWAWYERSWLYINEWLGCLIGSHLIADHPKIKQHLATRVSKSKITMIPYGAREVSNIEDSCLEKYGLKSKQFAIVIARPEPENSILPVIEAFSSTVRGIKLVVLGSYDEKNSYHFDVISAASEEVEFLGAIYDHDELDSLRYHSCLYVHGHTVGGTNPSLIEALGAGQPVVAHDNEFNRWVAGEKALYFKDVSDLNKIFGVIFNDCLQLELMSSWSRERFRTTFTWGLILNQYEEFLEGWL